MSDVDLPADEFARLRERTLTLYTAVVALMLVGIVALAIYSILLGPLTSPGAQESLGIAIALAFLMATVAVHVVDRTYRVWPLGRKVRPSVPGPVSEATQVRFLKVLVVVLVAAAIAYLIGALIAS